ncbi:zinc finger protein 773-like isoform X2 [Dunckerocampus dactyliophorus]|uniref:zinc finger protein 773-like isoform X2 n=1 Tax=Dunckerocampus dactyliophorus TaxID=161453 RepID=UPI0024059B7F|nr:zinc finger protein 773-like isoform X2 [Dunckerocampus dactyliophorus]
MLKLATLSHAYFFLGPLQANVRSAPGVGNLMAIAGELFGMLERRIASYKEELSGTKEEKERQRMEAVSKTGPGLHIDVQQGACSTLKQDDPQPHHFKEEEEELWIPRERGHLLRSEEAALARLLLTGVSTKTEDHEDKPQADNLLAPPSDGDGIQEALSSDADCEGVQQMTGHREEHPPQLQEQEDPQVPNVKEEDEELWITQEGERLLGLEEADLTKLPLTVISVKTEDHEDDPHVSSQLHQNRCPAGDRSSRRTPPSATGEELHFEARGSPAHHIKEEQDPQAPHMKEEEGELPTIQERKCLRGPEEADLTVLPQTGVSVKTEKHEDKPPESSQLHHSPSEENRGAEPPSSSSSSAPQHMTTEADGDHCGGSQADKLLAPLSDSDDATSQYPEDEDMDNTQEAVSSDTDCEGDMRTHSDNTCSEKKTGKEHLSCSFCGKIFSRKVIMLSHMRTHTGEKPFSCSVCGQRFSQKSNMLKHTRIHTGEKPFGCSVCGKRFFQKVEIVLHMRTHTGEKPFSCSVCGERYSRKSNIVSHMRTHTGEKPFSCSVCAKSFSQKRYLTQHAWTHTGKKPYECSVCSDRFAKRFTLMRHMTTHTGDKPFSCSVCDERFSRKSNMEAHMRTHTGEKPFSCSVCSKRFAQKSNMEAHVRSHTGEKPFRCSVCSQSYSYKKTLTAHMWTH